MSIYNALTSIAAVLIGLFSLTEQVNADTNFNVADDFSLASNPNGAWTYGYSTTLTGPIILNTEKGTMNGIDYWGTNIGVLNTPLTLHNTTAGVATCCFNTVQLQPGQFAFHPGPSNQYEKARLTISSPGIYAISGNFAGADVVGTTTDVHILFNGISIFDGSVSGFGSGTGPSFSFTKTLAANDTLDFAVGFGSNGNYFYDTTALAAQISAVPEASSASMFSIGGALLAALVFLRRKTESGRV